MTFFPTTFLRKSVGEPVWFEGGGRGGGDCPVGWRGDSSMIKIFIWLCIAYNIDSELNKHKYHFPDSFEEFCLRMYSR